MNKGPFCLVFICMSLMTDDLSAQSKPAPSNASPPPDQEEENLNVFQQWIRWNNPGSLLINHLNKQAMDYYEIRDREIAKLKTKSDWQSRQKWVKDKLMEMVGPFPEKTPLNPRITGTIKRKVTGLIRLFMNRCPDFMSQVVFMFLTALKERLRQY